MAKMIRHDYGAIHEALNNMIVAEVKAWLEQMPEKRMEGGSLCRVVVSPNGDYEPRDLCVEKVWLDDDGMLCFSGTENHGSYIVDDDPDAWTENDDLLDITDFAYLIDQMVEQLEMPEGAWYIMEGYMASCCHRTKEYVKQAIEKEVMI